jgi:hypothetical protein
MAIHQSPSIRVRNAPRLDGVQQLGIARVDERQGAASVRDTSSARQRQPQMSVDAALKSRRTAHPRVVVDHIVEIALTADDLHHLSDASPPALQKVTPVPKKIAAGAARVRRASSRVGRRTSCRKRSA